MRVLTALMLCFILVGCTASPRFTATKAVHVTTGGPYSMKEEGIASYYGDEFDGKPTSNGEIFDKNQMTAAHKSLPFNTKVRVTNLDNGLSTVVRINDRGPFVADRVIDLSVAAAKEIHMIGPGTARVRLEVLQLGPDPSKRSK